jgi:hypothetical protein
LALLAVFTLGTVWIADDRRIWFDQLVAAPNSTAACPARGQSSHLAQLHARASSRNTAAQESVLLRLLKSLQFARNRVVMLGIPPVDGDLLLSDDATGGQDKLVEQIINYAYCL